MILHKKKKEDVDDNNNDNETKENKKLNYDEYQKLKSFAFSIKFENRESSRLLYLIGKLIDGQIKSNINGKIKLTLWVKK